MTVLIVCVVFVKGVEHVHRETDVVEVVILPRTEGLEKVTVVVVKDIARQRPGILGRECCLEK